MTEAASSPRETRVSTLVGDRLCAGCGYNLTGQPVVREAHYGMLIVRCPECGTVASLQEYPLLGRWAGRWAVLLAALWLVTLLALGLVTASMLVGIAQQTAAAAARPFARYLSQKQVDDYKNQLASSSPNAQWITSQGAFAEGVLDKPWVAQQDLGALLAGAGGWWKAADRSALATRWCWGAAWSFPAGCVWAVALIHMRRRRLVLVGLVLLGLAAFFEVLSRWDESGAGGPWLLATVVADDVMGAPYAWLTLAFTALPLAAGLLLGRPLGRLAIRLLLPPRLRGALAGLWTAEGRAPPGGEKRPQGS